MKIKYAYRKRIEFYLINFELILHSQVGQKVRARVPFKSKKIYHKKKYREFLVRDEDMRWAQCSKRVLDGITYTSQHRMFYLVFINGEEINEVCDKVGIVKSTYFEWIKELMWTVLTALAMDGIFESEDVTAVLEF